MLETKIAAHMNSVRVYRERLAVLQGVWDNLSLLSQMSGDGTNMQSTRAAFERLAGSLLENLAAESLKKTMLAMQGKAQVAIDVLVRNLYERTADIGFICSDQDVQQYLLEWQRMRASPSDDTVRNALARRGQQLKRRFAEYVAKYSVYENIVLLAPDGEVLLQLAGEPAVAHSADPLVKEALGVSAGYVESFRAIDLFPHQPRSLVYSYRVTVEGRALGVLCLCFRLNDESDGIFNKLLESRDWTVLSYLDAEGRVIASSDPWQIPLNARFDSVGDQNGDVVRFAGREYLAVTRNAKPYQGYAGSGWRCQALIPLEQACNFETNERTTLPPAALAAVRKSSAVFSPQLKQVPAQAENIQRELNRTVWNGHIRIGNRGDTNNSFSKVLLWEVSNTGRKTQEVFENSISELERTVVSAILQDSHSMAALAVDILDRNLYERANDCRWWALDRTLCHYLSKPTDDAAQITAVLRQINQLYTVYHTLVLFDAQLRVVAVSNPRCESFIGKPLDESWAQATLGLADSQSYHVSAFEPNRLYDGKPTLTYCAALRTDNKRVVGGIGIVFDSAPQLGAMLGDALMRKHEGSVALYATKEGRVLSASGRYSPGDQLSLDRELLSPPAEGHMRIVAIEGTYFAIGVHATSGYREYPGLDALALVMIPLGAASAAESAITPTRSQARRSSSSERRLELATFRAGGHWLGVPLGQVIEAIDTSGLHALPEKVRGQAGYVMHSGKALLVADLAALLESEAQSVNREIVLIRTTTGKELGLLIEVLGEIPQVDAGDIIPSLEMFASHSLTDTMVRGEKSDEPLLLILNPDRVAAALNAGATKTARAATPMKRAAAG